ncbi:hypothetical protein [Pseudanabaena sp. PCC 6802]|uniref:hypothetical protein n=1 Tax=Pseudanabaena sp. PCC 6802 TaxID=118173 RepID=UPI0003461EB5|nr:hypothetical protein [Pseudanabaena sp. PCC 6802]
MNFRTILVNLPVNFPASLVIAGLICCYPLVSQAENVVLQVSKLLDKETTNCPPQVTIAETSKHYEGGYLRSGQANLQWLAGKFAIANSDAFSVTWVAALKPQYSTCRASAGIRNSQGYGSPHLRMRLIDSQVFLTLDMTGMRDTNNYTPSIVSRSTRNGVPAWQWAGTD